MNVSKQTSLIVAVKNLKQLLTRSQGLYILLIAFITLLLAGLEILTASILVILSATLVHSEAGLKYFSYFHWLIHGDPTPTRILLCMVFIFTLIYILRSAVYMIRVFFTQDLSSGVLYFIKNQLIVKHQKMKYSTYVKRSLADNIDSFFIIRFISNALLSLIDFVSEFIVSISLIAVVIKINPLLALTIFFILLSLSLFWYFLLRPAFNQVGALQSQLDCEQRHYLNELFSNFKEIFIFGIFHQFLNRYKENIEKERSMLRWISILRDLPRFIVELMFVGLFVIIVSFLLLYHASFHSTMATLTAYLYLGFRVLPGMHRMINYINEVKYSAPLINRVHRELVNEPEYPSILDIQHFRFEYSVSLKNISFQHNERKKVLFEGIELTIHKGEHVGIMGRTGVGKSTLLDLILGLLIPTSGQIVVDDQYPVNCKQWQQMIGYVPQRVHLINDTIAANIAFSQYGEPIDFIKLHRMIEMTQLEGLIERLPLGVKTCVGDNGVFLSGGERQRIAIARALYKEPEVLIFDEATSSLDKQTELQVLEVINTITKHYTMIMVAHQVETLVGCHKILTLDPDKIVISDWETVAKEYI